MKFIRVLENMTDLTAGKIYPVEDYVSKSNFWVRDNLGDRNGIPSYRPETWEESADSPELEELRAFKAAALARFPALAKPETDAAAIDRLESEHYNSYRSIEETIEAAFAWARANPR